MSEFLDTRKVVSHKDCRIRVTIEDETYAFAEAESFNVGLGVTNSDISPMGQALTQAVLVNYTITITLTELLIRDDFMIEKLVDALKNGRSIFFTFEGTVERYDGQESRQVYRDCVPSDTITLLNIAPGEVLKRDWSFRGNAAPEIISMFTD